MPEEDTDDPVDFDAEATLAAARAAGEENVLVGVFYDADFRTTDADFRTTDVDDRVDAIDREPERELGR